MCFADGSLAPRAPEAGEAGDQQALTLTAADGNVLLAHECRPVAPASVGVVVLPDVRGLHAYYRDLTVRLAEVGWHALAIDWFGRTADTEDRSDAFDFWPQVRRMTPEGIAADVATAVAHLRAAGVEHVLTLGFCFGGAASWRQSADTPGLAGCIGFYGRPDSPREVLDRMTASLLLLHAGADAHITRASVEALAADAPVAAELHVFDGMPHSFFDRTAPDHAAACVEAWGLVRGFVERCSRS